MQLRSNNHLVKSVEFFTDSSMEYEETLHPLAEKEKMLDQMELALEELTDEQKKCILLFYIEKNLSRNYARNGFNIYASKKQYTKW
ncbi:MAG: hypothetical protein IPN14_14470 [Bacteroidetes bacterium]|nr:hypothetical protein [Bacteroidota bacterium]